MCELGHNLTGMGFNLARCFVVQDSFRLFIEYEKHPKRSIEISYELKSVISRQMRQDSLGHRSNGKEIC